MTTRVWRWRAVVTGLLLVAASAQAYGQDQGRGMEILQAAARRYAPVSSLCADFVQHLSVPLLDDERTASGRLCQARPNLFGMRFTDPNGDLLVVDGESVWYYLPSNDAKQAFRAPVGRGTGGRDFQHEFLEDPELKYDVSYETSEQVAGKVSDRLRLVPKTPTSYRSAVLWIERGTSILRQIRLEEENGNRRTITLSNIVFNAAPPAGWFSFTPPPGVLVISR